MIVDQVLPSLEVLEGFLSVFFVWVSLLLDVIRVLTIILGMFDDLLDLVGFFLVFWGDFYGVVNGCVGVCSF